MERYIDHPLKWPQVRSMFTLAEPVYDMEAWEDYRKVKAILFRIENEHLRHWLRCHNMLFRPGPPHIKEKRRRLEQEWGDYINGMLEKASKIQMMVALRQRN